MKWDNSLDFNVRVARTHFRWHTNLNVNFCNMSSNHDKWISFSTYFIRQSPTHADTHNKEHTLCVHLAVSSINFNYKLFESCEVFILCVLPPIVQAKFHFILPTGHFIPNGECDTIRLGSHKRAETIFCTMNLPSNWWPPRRKSANRKAKCVYKTTSIYACYFPLLRCFFVANACRLPSFNCVKMFYCSLFSLHLSTSSLSLSHLSLCVCLF